MSDMTRRQLKKNELEDFMLTSAAWIKNNRQMAATIAGMALFVLALSIFFFVRYSAVRERADDKLSFAQANFFQGKPEEGVRILDEIISQYPGTFADYKARMHKTAYYLEMGKYDEAEQTIIPAADKGKPKEIMPLAMSMLGAIYENSGKHKQAIETYNSFLDKYPEHFLTPKIYESLARVYGLSGSAQEERTTYEKLATLYPATAWAQRAQQRMSAIPPATQAPAANN